MSVAEPDPNTVSVWLEQIRHGDQAANEQLFEHLCHTLRSTANNLMNDQPPDHTLQATALINEACARLIQSGVLDEAPNRRYLYAAAHRAMWQILVDHARRKRAQKRGRDLRRTRLDFVLEQIEARNQCDTLDLQEALTRLGRHSPEQVEIIQLHFLHGFTFREISELLGQDERTIRRKRKLGIARLRTMLFGKSAGPDSFC